MKHPHTPYIPPPEMAVDIIAVVTVKPKFNEKFPSDDTLSLKFASSDLDAGKSFFFFFVLFKELKKKKKKIYLYYLLLLLSSSLLSV